MSILGLVGDAINGLSGGLVNSIGDTVKKFVTTDKDRLEAQEAVEKQVAEFSLSVIDRLQVAEVQLTDRQKIDMASDSWLSKNIRPLVLAFLTVATVLLAYLTVFILSPEKISLLSPWIDTLKDLLQTAFVFYFGSRGLEKIGQMAANVIPQRLGQGTPNR
jgi:hypothetical protein